MPSDAAAPAGRCPICRRPRVAEFRPFCSRGCRDRDLNRWFGEAYRVAADEAPDEAPEAAADAAAPDDPDAR